MIANTEKVDCTGTAPAARFGHTITYIQKGKAILFGGWNNNAHNL